MEKTSWDEKYEELKKRRIAVMTKQSVYNHYFCALCGQEITYLNLRTGTLIQRIHTLHDTKEGLRVRICWRKSLCKKRSEKGTE